MRKLSIVMTVMALALFAGAITASAQTTIAFGNGGGGSTGEVTFIANAGGSASLDLGKCIGLSCRLSGSNTGGGTYSFITTETSPNQIQVSSGFISGLNRGVSMNGATTSFAYSNGMGGTLTGSVVWSSLVTDGTATISGLLTITSSTIAGLTGQANITITTGKYAQSPFTYIFNGAPGNTEGALMASGSIISSTPEPTSMLLFGTGLLAFSVILRRRLA